MGHAWHGSAYCACGPEYRLQQEILDRCDRYDPDERQDRPGGAGALPANSWVVPQNVKPSNGVSPSQSDGENFGWQTFVAINWPSATPSASGIFGLPNTQLTIGASSSNGAMIPAVWGTFRSENNTMVAAAQDRARGRTTRYRLRRGVRR
jgi:hypothetical protein